jgi:tetrahydromethanopterin S-methyltransferase subunit H
LFKFNTEQKIYDICGLKIGGQPGQLPTVMIGSIFYHKDKIVIDAKAGIFEKTQAEQILNAEQDISMATGNPRLVDVCASWPEAFPKEIEFVASVAKGPFTIDGTTAEVRMAGAKYVKEVGLSERVVYNSISPETKDNELAAIRDAKIKAALLLALNTKNPTITGRLAVIDTLIEKAKNAGVETLLVDTTVLDVPDPGPAGKTAYLVKEKYGLPCGCGAHNAVDMWHRRKKLDPDSHLTSSVVANTLPVIMGSNFMLYGPITSAAKIYTPIAVTDAYIAYTMMQQYNIRPITNTHPLFRIFRT